MMEAGTGSDLMTPPLPEAPNLRPPALQLTSSPVRDGSAVFEQMMKSSHDVILTALPQLV